MPLSRPALRCNVDTTSVPEYNVYGMCDAGSTEWETVDITPLGEAKEGGRAYYE